MTLSPSFALAALAAALLHAAPAAAQTLEPLWTLEGFDAPESVLVDPDRDRLIVSSIDGHPGQADGEGYLSLVSPEGRMIAARWVTGLDAPKGMAIADGRLFVSDLTRLHVIDPGSGEVLEVVDHADAVFLNDVTATPDGRVFVTDMMDHAIYVYAGGRLTPWLRSSTLRHPNGILADGERLLVGSWGQELRADFTTAVPGSLLAVDLASKAVTPLPGAAKIGNLDGLVRAGETLFVSDWVAGNVMAWRADGRTSTVLQVAPSVADIGGHGHTLYLPMMNDGTVVAYQLDGDW